MKRFSVEFSSDIIQCYKRAPSYFLNTTQHMWGANISLLHSQLIETVISGSLPPWQGAPPGCGRRNGLQIWRVPANILSSRGQPTTVVL